MARREPSNDERRQILDVGCCIDNAIHAIRAVIAVVIIAVAQDDCTAPIRSVLPFVLVQVVKFIFTAVPVRIHVEIRFWGAEGSLPVAHTPRHLYVDSSWCIDLNRNGHAGAAAYEMPQRTYGPVVIAWLIATTARSQANHIAWTDHAWPAAVTGMNVNSCCIARILTNPTLRRMASVPRKTNPRRLRNMIGSSRGSAQP